MMENKKRHVIFSKMTCLLNWANWSTGSVQASGGGADSPVSGEAELALAYDLIQGLFEFRAGREARQRVGDVAGAHVPGILLPFAVGAQPEGTEIPQLHDVAVGQFLRDDVQHGIQHGQYIGPADGGIVRDALRKLAQGLPPGGLDGRVILIRRARVTRVTSFYDVKFDSHNAVSLYLIWNHSVNINFEFPTPDIRWMAEWFEE